MQYHLDGFRPGDPFVAPEASGVADMPEDDVDVLIVGCGPAGLTLAAQLSAFPTLRTRIVDLKPGPLEIGQADGVACRSKEMFEAFGFADRVVREAYWVNETAFWRPSADEPHRIERVDRIQDVEDGLSEFPHTILSQARVHDFYLEVMRKSPRRLEPDYGLRFEGLRIDGEQVVATLRPVGDAEDGSALPTETQQVRARYLVGCDGARSAVRSSLGLELVGDSANKLWGVMDVLAVSDFPDIRLKCAIQSATAGSMLVIPREGGYLVRIYTELGELGTGERARDRNLTLDELIAAAQRILAPYTLDVKEVAWWSAYEIGQRLSHSFDSSGVVDDGTSPRVFIVGDACHTHSPKAGQGMNVSMADSFNLGWKLASVLLGRSADELLQTYTAERQAVAAELIDFDRDMASLFSVRADQNGTGRSSAATSPARSTSSRPEESTAMSAASSSSAPTNTSPPCYPSTPAPN